MLLIDADPQGNSTSGVGVFNGDIKVSIYDCMVNDADPKSAIISTDTPNLDILPSHIDLVGADVELVNRWRREYVIKDIIDKIRDNYDYVFIDCLPSLGVEPDNAQTAADSELVPVQ